MADFEDLTPFGPPPTRPTSAFPVEPERRSGARREDPAPTQESVAFRIRVVLRHALGSSWVMLLVASALVGGTVVLGRAVAPTAPATPPRQMQRAPTVDPIVVPEVPATRAVSDTPVRSYRPVRSKAHQVANRSGFRFSSSAPPAAAAPSSGLSSQEASQPSSRESVHASRRPDPKPTPPPPYTPTMILLRLLHPNGAYYFTTDTETAMHKEGYDGYVSERAALVWEERRGASMIRLELSDDSVAWVFARESDVPDGDPAPLYSATTRRYGRFYSLDREQAAEVGPVSIYGWVATY